MAKREKREDLANGCNMGGLGIFSQSLTEKESRFQCRVYGGFDKKKVYKPLKYNEL